jgi:hypothetical protein
MYSNEYATNSLSCAVSRVKGTQTVGEEIHMAFSINWKTMHHQHPHLPFFFFRSHHGLNSSLNFSMAFVWISSTSTSFQLHSERTSFVPSLTLLKTFPTSPLSFITESSSWIDSAWNGVQPETRELLTALKNSHFDPRVKFFKYTFIIIREFPDLNEGLMRNGSIPGTSKTYISSQQSPHCLWDPSSLPSDEHREFFRRG